MQKALKNIFSPTKPKILLTIFLTLALSLPLLLVIIDSDPTYSLFGTILSISTLFLTIPISFISNALSILFNSLFSDFTFWKNEKENIALMTFMVIGIIYTYIFSSLIIYFFNILSKQKREKK